MALHPQCATLIEAARAAGTGFGATDHVAARRAYNATTALYRQDAPPLDSVVTVAADGPGGFLPVRLYRPFRAATAGPAPWLVYYHGGGWVVGDLESHDHLCRHLATASGVVVAAVDYRLAPEHPFPAAFDDACAAVRWLARRATEYRLDPARYALGGDSAGGNLAAAVALALRDAGGVQPRLQVLLYPAIDMTADNASLRDNATGYLLTRAAMDQFVAWYVPDPADRNDWRASPQCATSHRGLPSACIVSAEFDPLRDEAVRYAETLAAAGVAVEHRPYAGMIHGFARMGARIDAARDALDDCAQALARAFAD